MNGPTSGSEPPDQDPRDSDPLELARRLLAAQGDSTNPGEDPLALARRLLEAQGDPTSSTEDPLGLARRLLEAQGDSASPAEDPLSLVRRQTKAQGEPPREDPLTLARRLLEAQGEPASPAEDSLGLARRLLEAQAEPEAGGRNPTEPAPGLPQTAPDLPEVSTGLELPQFPEMATGLPEQGLREATGAHPEARPDTAVPGTGQLTTAPGLAPIGRGPTPRSESGSEEDPLALARRLMEEQDPALLAQRLMEQQDPLYLANRLLREHDLVADSAPSGGSSPLLGGVPEEQGEVAPVAFDPLGLASQPALMGPAEVPVDDLPLTGGSGDFTPAPPLSSWPEPVGAGALPIGGIPTIRVEDDDTGTNLPALREEAPPQPPPRPAPPAPTPGRIRPPWQTGDVPREQEPARPGARPAPEPTPSPARPAAAKAGAVAAPVRARRREDDAEASPGPLGAQVARFRRMFNRRERITPDDLVMFTRQFQAMVSAGLPLHQSLYFYAESDDVSGLGPVIETVADRIGEGSTLSSALRRYPEVFSEVYTGLIAAGESTGMMTAILSKLADLSERNHRIRKKVISTLTYPAVLMMVSGGCILAFMYFVLPMMVPLFKSLNVELPLPTRMLLGMSELMKSPYFVVAAICLPILLFLFAPLFKLSPTGDSTRLRRWHRIPLDIPWVGRVLEKIITSRVLFSLSTLLDAGIALNSCLEKCERVAGNAEVAYRLRRAREQLVGGASAAECLGANGVFPPGAIQMIMVGEESAHLSEMMHRVALVYEDDVEMAMTDLAALLEPVILVGMGLIVGFVVLAAVLPTVQLLNTL